MARNEKQSSRKPVWLLILAIFLILAIGLTALYLVLRQLRSDQKNPPSQPTGHADTSPVQPGSSTAPAGDSTPVPDSGTANNHTSNTSEASTESGTSETDPVLADVPADFPALQKINADLYAWIEIPMGREDWDISLPILHPHGSDDDNYYLHHNIYRRYEYTGSLYTQRANALDFQDPVTVIYGHNMYDDSTAMFSKLVCFQVWFLPSLHIL